MLLYEMKFIVPNYSCLQNPWLGGYRPQIPVLSVFCLQLNLLKPPEQKFLGTPLDMTWHPTHVCNSSNEGANSQNERTLRSFWPQCSCFQATYAIREWEIYLTNSASLPRHLVVLLSNKMHNFYEMCRPDPNSNLLVHMSRLPPHFH